MAGRKEGWLHRRRVVAAGFIVLVSALVAWLLLSSSSATAGNPVGPALLPDLIVEPPEEIVLQAPPGSKKIYLRFSHTTSNVGQGPLEIYPDLTTESCGPQAIAAASPTRRSSRTETAGAAPTECSTGSRTRRPSRSPSGA